MAVFHFSDITKKNLKAHNGQGYVQAATVRKRLETSSINFIDIVEVPPASTIGLHQHTSTDEEIYVVVQGTADVFLDNRTHRVSSGDVLVNPPGGIHALKVVGTETLRLIVVDVSTDGSPYQTPKDLA